MKKQKKQVKVTLKITSEALKDVAINLYVLKFYQIIYEAKKNPIAPWRAFKLCRKMGHNPPEWILTYLEGCSTGIASTEKLTKDKLFKSLKFHKNSGERAFTTEFKEVKKYFPAVRDCYILNKLGDRKKPELKSMADIFSLVAERTNLDEAVINKHFYRYQKIIKDLFNERIKGVIEIKSQKKKCELDIYKNIMIDTVKNRYPTFIQPDLA